jgi:hypothetical protein
MHHKIIMVPSVGQCVSTYARFARIKTGKLSGRTESFINIHRWSYILHIRTWTYVSDSWLFSDHIPNNFWNLVQPSEEAAQPAATLPLFLLPGSESTAIVPIACCIVRHCLNSQGQLSASAQIQLCMSVSPVSANIWVKFSILKFISLLPNWGVTLPKEIE